MNISIYDLLVGDIMHIETGDVVAVDGVLVNGSGIQVDESSLSGESELVHKTAIATDGEPKQADKPKPKSEKQMTHRVTASDPFILSGTTVNGGVGNYLVISVGTNSTFGRTLMNLRTDVEETPLQQKLGKLARQLITLGALAGLVFFLVMFIRFCVAIPGSNGTPASHAMEFFKTLILAVTVVVVTVPEGLALAVTLGLAFATSRMLKDKNLVRMIRSCEVMGNATCICSDKTGTLTQNVMTVVAGNIGAAEAFGQEAGVEGEVGTVNGKAATMESDNSPEASGSDVKKSAPVPAAASARQLVSSLAPEVKALLKSGIVHNTTAFESDDGFVGMSTETALLKFAREHLAMGPLNEERTNADIVDMFPFDASNKWMAVMVKLPGDGGYRLLVKGAAEVLLDQCTRALSDPKNEGDAGLTTEDFTPEMHENLRQVVQSYAVKMLRPVAMAYRDFQDPTEVFEDVKDTTSIDFKAKFASLTFLSLFAIKDPLRPEVNDAVRKCQEAGVFVRMVTGDNFLTAKAIATECGIYTAGGIAMDGPTFRKLSEAQLDLVIPRLQVLARSSPEDKLLLVSHLKGMMETVAVTGDGTNDALALKAADVGFAMGIQGTEVAKEAASIILLDDNFTSIVKALSWGRTVNDAVRKFLQFQFTINITAGTLTVVSELSGDNIFKVVQLLWMNLIMVSVMSRTYLLPTTLSKSPILTTSGHFCIPRIGNRLPLSRLPQAQASTSQDVAGELDNVEDDCGPSSVPTHRHLHAPLRQGRTMEPPDQTPRGPAADSRLQHLRVDAVLQPAQLPTRRQQAQHLVPGRTEESLVHRGAVPHLCRPNDHHLQGRPGVPDGAPGRATVGLVHALWHPHHPPRRPHPAHARPVRRQGLSLFRPGSAVPLARRAGVCAVQVEQEEAQPPGAAPQPA